MPLTRFWPPQMQLFDHIEVGGDGQMVPALPSRPRSPTLERHHRSNGLLAQLVRAPALQAGCRGFESLTAHHYPSCNETDKTLPGLRGWQNLDHSGPIRNSAENGHPPDGVAVSAFRVLFYSATASGSRWVSRATIPLLRFWLPERKPFAGTLARNLSTRGSPRPHRATVL